MVEYKIRTLKQQVPSKGFYPSTNMHGVTSQKTAMVSRIKLRNPDCWRKPWILRWL